MRVDQLVLATCAWFLTYAVHSTVLIGFAWVTSTLLERFGRAETWIAVVRERLWKLALVGGLATATVQTALGIGPWNLGAELRESKPAAIEALATLPANRTQLPTETQLPRHTRPATEKQSPGEIRSTGEPAPMLIPAVWVPIAHRLVATDSSAGTQAPKPHALEAERTPSASSLTVPPVLLRAILAVWAVGVMFGLVRWASDWRRLLAALDCRVRIVSGLAHEVFRGLVQRAGIGGHVHLYSAPRIGAPITLGFAQPAICLPPRAETELQRDELEALLAHELAHALRRDPAWLCACRVIEVLFFFQPLNRVARVHLADEAEYLCDDWAVRHTRERLPLASCLTEIASWIVGRERDLPVPGMAARGSRLELRVRRLLDGRDRSAADAPRWMSPLAWSAVAAVAFFVPGVSAKSSGGIEAGLFAQSTTPTDSSASPSTSQGVASQRIASPDFASPGVASPVDVSRGDELFDVDENPPELAESADDSDRSDDASETLADARDDDDVQPRMVSDDEPSHPCPTEAPAAEAQLAPPSDVATCTKTSDAKGACTAKAPECSAPVACAPEALASTTLAKAGTTPVVSSLNGTFSFSMPLTGTMILNPSGPSSVLSTSSGALMPNGTELDASRSLFAGALSLDDARAFQADVTALEESFKALKHEVGQRRASAEFKSRIATLERQLQVLHDRRNQLSILLTMPGLKVDAPRGAQDKDHLNTKDRK